MEQNLFLLLKKLYTKQNLSFKEIKDLDTKSCIFLMTYLSQDDGLVHLLKKAVGYIFTIDPKYFYIYLYCVIPRKSKPPFLKISKKDKEKNDKLLDKMKYVYKWGDNDSRENEEIIKKLLDMDRNYFETKFGVEGDEKQK